MKSLPDSALERIAVRSSQDLEFRRRLLRDPRAAIEDATGTPVPPDLRIKFVEKDADVDVVIVLPDYLKEEGELTEEEVADVAGGTNWGCADETTA